MKRLVLTVLILSLAVLFVNQSIAAEVAPEETVQQKSLERVESVIYGTPATGGMFIRLARVERDLFGMELPGSLTERQQALLSFVEDGTPTQPSLIFKIGVAEWVTTSRVNPRIPLSERISNLEYSLEGEEQMGALSARLERILTKLLPNGVYATPVTIPAGSTFKAAFAKKLTVRTVSVGDIVELNVEDDLIIGGNLTVAKGDRVFGTVTKIKMPRSFGRSSEIGIEFNEIESIGGQTSKVIVGENAKKAMNIDSSTIGAAGASIAGALIVGPLGLASGFLVRGNDKQIQEGTLVYVETAEVSTVAGYPTVGGPAVAPTVETYPSSQTADFVPVDDSGQTAPPGETY
jgi:hypothetical protein